MAAVAIEEWQASSPWYTRRMQQALKYEGDDIVTIFKGLQLDIGAPPQFMDFRFRVDDRDHGEFWLDHCGALMDVEPLGEEYVTAMCHDIEDPTFDATALATNPYAQVRPIHRPPRSPEDRHPHCAWTVTIDPAHVPPVVEPHTEALGRTAARSVELSPIVPGGGGRDDYSGPLLSDVRFDDFSHSALVRIAEEVCLQQHMLTLGFLIGVRKRTDEASASTLLRKQLTGIAGLTSERIRNALGLSGTSTDSRKCSVSTPSSRRNSTSGAPSRSTMITSGYVSAVTGASMSTVGGRPSSTPITSHRSMRSSAGSTRTSRRGSSRSHPTHSSST